MIFYGCMQHFFGQTALGKVRLPAIFLEPPIAGYWQENLKPPDTLKVH